MPLQYSSGVALGAVEESCHFDRKGAQVQGLGFCQSRVWLVGAELRALGARRKVCSARELTATPPRGPSGPPLACTADDDEQPAGAGGGRVVLESASPGGLPSLLMAYADDEEEEEDTLPLRGGRAGRCCPPCRACIPAAARTRLGCRRHAGRMQLIERSPREEAGAAGQSLHGPSLAPHAMQRIGPHSTGSQPRVPPPPPPPPPHPRSCRHAQALPCRAAARLAAPREAVPVDGQQPGRQRRLADRHRRQEQPAAAVASQRLAPCARALDAFPPGLVFPLRWAARPVPPVARAPLFLLQPTPTA